MEPHQSNPDYAALRKQFRWELPADLNIGVLCADRHASDELALIHVEPDSGRREYTFGDLRRLSDQLANALRGIGVEAGDRVGIVLPQRLETGLAHLAVYKLGAIAVPMSTLFGPQGFTYRLGDCAARAVITGAEHVEVVAAVAAELGGLQIVVVDDAVAAPHHGFWPMLEAASDRFQPQPTTPDTPALLIYTSGTTGAPKGALHGHRALLGHLPGFQLSHDFFPHRGDRFWTPADWAWIGGLFDALMPTWYYGRPIVSAPRQGFDPEWALRLMAELEVRNAFLPPTALKMMRQAGGGSAGDLALRSVMSGGETLGEQMLAWGHEHLGVTINEIYGQTEANLVAGSCAAAWEPRPGSLGRPYPGHEVVVLGADGSAPAAAGEVGEIAVAAPDPVFFLEYWGNPQATRAKYSEDGRWLLTGDLARRDEDGYLWYEARADDVINSAGYRIGPAEIEECLLHHEAVAMAAVIGVPDPLRGEAVKAFIQLADSHAPSAELEGEVRQLVRQRLAAYEYPRQIEFVERLPLTTTGKIRRAELRRLSQPEKLDHTTREDQFDA
ncbi:MAG TPA: AMP-binding protein [Solirubrobacterales bacterium]|jgi:acetyl-CoA synthetase|nr:AMP-binding protein [Solirubrobacterales bacterium]